MKRVIGDTDLEVFPIGLGAMPMSLRGRPSEEQAKAVILTALEAGVDFIDTANCYCIDNSDFGHNERLVAGVVRNSSNSARVIIATKGGLTRPQGRWETDGRPESLRSACEQSLESLGVETIDLYQYHAPDTAVPFTESIGELGRLREEGKIANVGLSNVEQHHIKIARKIVPIASVQNKCNVLYKKDLANGLLDYCGVEGITYIPYSPVGGGHGHRRLSGVEALSTIAHEHDSSVYCIALAWLLHKGNHVLPIPGASRVASIEDSVKAVDIKLSEEEVLSLDALSE
ncbi:MAG: aldo/keto reductase [Arenicellales bacterium]|nr:aldo/keto reductase [Arenicellales bacterium]